MTLLIRGEIRSGVCGCSGVRRKGVQHLGIGNADKVGAKFEGQGLDLGGVQRWRRGICSISTIYGLRHDRSLAPNP